MNIAIKFCFLQLKIQIKQWVPPKARIIIVNSIIIPLEICIRKQYHIMIPVQTPPLPLSHAIMDNKKH